MAVGNNWQETIQLTEAGYFNRIPAREPQYELLAVVSPDEQSPRYHRTGKS
jgi:hypothetical protein